MLLSTAQRQDGKLGELPNLPLALGPVTCNDVGLLDSEGTGGARLLPRVAHPKN